MSSPGQAVKDADTVGTITYNGIPFKPFRKYSCHGTMVWDASDRTVAYIQYKLSVEALIYSDSISAQDSSMDALQANLSAPTRELIISGIGFGGVGSVFGTTDTTPDVVWGAKPRVLGMKPAAGGIGWWITWECEFNRSFARSAYSDNVLGSGGRAGFEKLFLSFSFECAYQTDGLGFTTRNISGEVQIPNLVVARGDSDTVATLDAFARTPQVTADAVRDAITIQLPANFKRTENQWRENKSKNILEFSVTDEELKTDPFPAGIADMNLDYGFRFVGKAGTGSIGWEIGGTIEVLPGYPKQLAVATFLTIAVDKLLRLQRGSGSQGENTQNFTIPTGMSVRHSLGTRKSTFSASFLQVSCIADALLNGGIWEPLPDSNYQRWASSVQQTPTGKNLWGNRGASGLAVNPDDAIIIDLGLPTNKMTIGRDTVGQPGGTSGTNYNTPFSCGTIDPANSWLDYRVVVKVKRIEKVVEHTISQPWKLVQDIISSFADTTVNIGPAFSSSGDGSTPKSNPVEVVGSPSNWALLQWQGIRLQLPPVPPTLQSVGGQKAIPINMSPVAPEAVADFFGTPAFYGEGWTIYRLEDGYVSDVKNKKNILVCSQKNSDTADGQVTSNASNQLSQNGLPTNVNFNSGD